MDPSEYVNTVETLTIIPGKIDKELDNIVDLLLGVLPPSKCLYKYRPIDSKFYLDNLQYIFLPAVNILNDKIDTTLLYKVEHNIDELLDFYDKNKYLVYKYYYTRKISNKKDDLKIKALNYLIKGKTPFETAKLLNKDNYNKTLSVVLELINNVNEVSTSRAVVDDIVENYNIVGEKMRSDFHVFSLSERYDIDSMWAYYCNKNKGYVVEYNFNKIRSLSNNDKKKLIFTYKVKYDNKKPCFDMISFYKNLYEGCIDHIKTANMNVNFNKQLITKKKSWSNELEWRIINASGDDKYYIDIISKVIIDESIVDDERTLEIIAHAFNKGWKVQLRKLDVDTCDFAYLDFKQTKYWRQKRSKIKCLQRNLN